MRRAAIVLALVLSAQLIPVTAARAADRSSSPGLPVLAAGRVLDQSGTALAGEVSAFAWPDTSRIEVGDEVRLILVARSTIDSAGEFALQAAPTPELQQAAAANGGHLNLTIVTTAGGRFTPHAFSRFTSGGSRVGGSPTWTARPGEDKTPLTIRVTDDAPPATARPMAQKTCYPATVKLLERTVGSTVIGEYHTEADTVPGDSYFHYGQSADSDISVGMKFGGKGWRLSGEHHVGNHRGGMIGKEDPPPNFSAQLLTDFAYGRYEMNGLNCGMGKYEEIRPIEWQAGSTERFYSSPGCNPNDRNRTKEWHSGHVFTRDEQRAEKVVKGVEVFGVSLTTQSGYSNLVRAHWKFGNAYELHYLCGNDGDPYRATRIFAGLPEPRRDCRPGRPC